ncbi:MAG TPA: protein phosphatase, partial [Micromonosporaceae bacterium]
DDDRPRRRPVRTAALLIGLLAILGAGLWTGWSYTQRQYYVGATEEGQLAVFRGVQGEVAGLSLSGVHSTSATKLDDLTAAAQEQVKQGIQARSETDAQQRLAELTTDSPSNPNLKPTCPPTPTPTPTSAASPTPAVGPRTGAPTAAASGGTTTIPRGGTAAPGRATSTPTNAPDAPATSDLPQVNDPAGCRTVE